MATASGVIPSGKYTLDDGSGNGSAGDASGASTLFGSSGACSTKTDLSRASSCICCAIEWAAKERDPAIALHAKRRKKLLSRFSSVALRDECHRTTGLRNGHIGQTVTILLPFKAITRSRLLRSHGVIIAILREASLIVRAVLS